MIYYTIIKWKETQFDDKGKGGKWNIMDFFFYLSEDMTAT